MAAATAGRMARTTAGRGSSTGRKRFITNAGRPARTSSPLAPGTRRRITRDQRLHRHGRARPASPSGGSRRRWGCTRAPPASCSSRTAGSRPTRCSASRATAGRSSSRSSTAAGSRSAPWPSGLSQAALDASVPYARERKQFGRPIGTFQGVAFMIADMSTEIEAARADGLARGLDQGPGPGLLAGRGAGQAVRVRGLAARHEQRACRSTAATATSRSTRSSASCATPS